MSFQFYYHPLASFCHKVLIALYTKGIHFEPVLVDLAHAQSRAQFTQIWPFAKMPVWHESSGAGTRTIAETSIIIEYLDQRFPDTARLIPSEPERALQVRFWDRFFDLYVQEPMQKIVGDKIRPAGKTDPYGVEQARQQLAKSYAYLEKHLAQPWAMGAEFTLADCAAAPALQFANRVQPLGAEHPITAAYLARLLRQPAFERTMAEAQPYFHLFPG